MGKTLTGTPQQKLQTQIGWLNANAGLVQNLSFDDVIMPLCSVDVYQALKILKDLEKSATSIKNPTNYVISAVARIMGDAGMGGMGGGMGGMDGAMLVDPTGKIGKTIGWLNNKGGLKEPLKYKEVVEILSACDVKDAMKILKDVEEKSSDIKSPTGYVVNAARRVSKGHPSSFNGGGFGASGFGGGGFGASGFGGGGGMGDMMQMMQMMRMMSGMSAAMGMMAGEGGMGMGGMGMGGMGMGGMGGMGMGGMMEMMQSMGMDNGGAGMGSALDELMGGKGGKSGKGKKGNRSSPY
eukprot:gnl/MRDRNA2_/MRDRNA2_77611_c0_seq1.p1 gnl/MRDRNA2_/MRDRNA2_77611_c0~~gnl/MRDRNA2_/MRDRNA2_77611_c0_seq1.p1  ORF type:complete len:295 (-),score=78.15 gnl/MRDRNA2_/MRDRNA2_77611_c0_seq1:200-1084(-)